MMILLRQWSIKYSHDGIPDKFIDRAFMALNDAAGTVQISIQQIRETIRGKLFGQGGKPGNVRKDK